MNITIICVGKSKQPYSPLFEEYEKRLCKYCKLSVVELKEKPNNNVAKELNDEAKDIEKHAKGAVYLLDKGGKQISSEDLAALLKKDPNITFIIGSHVGLSDNLKRKYKNISFGMMTLPHQLARLVLTEQVYKGFTILNNENYHK